MSLWGHLPDSDGWNVVNSREPNRSCAVQPSSREKRHFDERAESSNTVESKTCLNYKSRPWDVKDFDGFEWAPTIGRFLFTQKFRWVARWKEEELHVLPSVRLTVTLLLLLPATVALRGHRLFSYPTPRPNRIPDKSTDVPGTRERDFGWQVIRVIYKLSRFKRLTRWHVRCTPIGGGVQRMATAVVRLHGVRNVLRPSIGAVHNRWYAKVINEEYATFFEK